MPTYQRLVPQAVQAIAVEPEMKSILTRAAEKELVETMFNAEPDLLAVFTRHLNDSGELGVETTMRWVQESRFEVESDRDIVLDSQMELRMMDMLNTHISRHVEPSVQSAIDSAVKSAENSVIARIRLTMSQLISSVDRRWTEEYIRVWICKWKTGEIVYQASEGDRASVQRWVDAWYEMHVRRQVDDLISRMQLSVNDIDDLIPRLQIGKDDGLVDDWLVDYFNRRKYKKGVRGIIWQCVCDWHQRDGVFEIGASDTSSAELQAKIEEKIEGVTTSKASDARSSALPDTDSGI